MLLFPPTLTRTQLKVSFFLSFSKENCSVLALTCIMPAAFVEILDWSINKTYLPYNFNVNKYGCLLGKIKQIKWMEERGNETQGDR